MGGSQESPWCLCFLQLSPFLLDFFFKHCGILVLQPGTDPRDAAGKAPSPNHRTPTREVPLLHVWGVWPGEPESLHSRPAYATEVSPGQI